jgi:coiled-coil and C2 domain-containing protein 2A
VSHNDRVQREMRGCLINGHILALPFSDSYADAVAEAVLNTGVHRTTDERVKFAMAAHVETLGSAYVCCLWVYVAAIRETS